MRAAIASRSFFCLRAARLLSSARALLPMRVGQQGGRVRSHTGVAKPVAVSSDPAAHFFINHSLDHAFGGTGKWHNAFTHHDKHHIERAMGTGVVMDRTWDRKKQTPQRLLDSRATTLQWFERIRFVLFCSWWECSRRRIARRRRSRRRRRSPTSRATRPTTARRFAPALC